MRLLIYGWAFLCVAAFAGCGEDASSGPTGAGDAISGGDSVGVDAAVLAEARSAVAAAGASVEQAERELAALADSVAAYEQLSEQIQAAETQSKEQKKVADDLQRYYKKNKLVMPRKDRRKYLDASSAHKALDKKLPALREQLAGMADTAEQHAKAVERLEQARLAQDQAKQHLAELEAGQ